MSKRSVDEIVSGAKQSLSDVNRNVFGQLNSTADNLADELNEYHSDLSFHVGDWKREGVVNAYDNANIQLGHAERSGDLYKAQERIEHIYVSLTKENGVIEQAEQMRASLTGTRGPFAAFDLSKLPEDADVDRGEVDQLIQQLDQQLETIINDELERMRLMAKKYKD